MNKRYFLGIAVTFVSLPICFGAIAFASKSDIQKSYVKASTYTVTLTSDVFRYSILNSSDYTLNARQDFGNERGTMSYYLAKLDASNNLVLAPSGKVFNYSPTATYKGRITNIESIKVLYSGGSLSVQEGMSGDSETYDKRVVLPNDTEVVFGSKPNHIMIANDLAATTITSIQISYSCQEAGFDVSRLGTKYNGKSEQGNVVTLERNGNNVTLGGLEGTIALDTNGNFTMTLDGGNVVYTGTVRKDYKTLNFFSKTGSGSASAPTLSEMNKVYIVDDFESYAQTGTGYTTNNVAGRKSAYGLRAKYYGDYAGGGTTTWVSGSNFNYAVSSDYLNLSSTFKHSGNKGATVKSWKDGWTRLWSIEAFDQNQHYTFGSGDTFSFWAHGAFKETSCTTPFTDKSVHLIVVVYYQNFALTDGNRKTAEMGTGSVDFYITANSDWTEYKVNIDPTREVYAINIMAENTGVTNVFVPIDDMTVYTAPKYQPQRAFEENGTKLTKTYHGSVTVVSTSFTVKIGLGANGYIYAYAGTNMQPTGYNINGNQIVINTSGSYSSLTFGTWTGTLSNNNKTITIPKSGISGTIKQYVKTDPIVLNEDTVLASGSEGTATLQYACTKQFYNNGWSTDSSAANRIYSTKQFYIEGGSAIAVGRKPGYSTRIFANANITFESLSFWYYVPPTGSLEIRLYVYSGQNQTGNSPGSLPLYKSYSDAGEDGGWHYINTGIDASYRGSFAIFLQTNNPAALIDYITYL